MYVENRTKIANFPTPCVIKAPAEGVPLGILYRRRGLKRVMGLSDGRKRFRIGLAVLIQYRSVTDTEPATQPASHVAVAITLNAKASSLKTLPGPLPSSNRDSTNEVTRERERVKLAD